MTTQIVAHEEVGLAFRAARKAAGLSAEQLAVQAGLSSATVRRVEAGTTNAHRSTMTALIEALRKYEDKS